jgi:hypothetical protein
MWGWSEPGWAYGSFMYLHGKFGEEEETFRSEDLMVLRGLHMLWPPEVIDLVVKETAGSFMSSALAMPHPSLLLTFMMVEVWNAIEDLRLKDSEALPTRKTIPLLASRYRIY